MKETKLEQWEKIAYTILADPKASRSEVDCALTGITQSENTWLREQLQLKRTKDAYCKGHLFELKTGQVRDYKQQMAAYALGVMQKFGDKKLTCHLVYSRFKRADTFDLTITEAQDIVYGIMDSVNDPTRSPWPCSYCAWCARKESCTALNQFAYTVTGQLEAMRKINLNGPITPAVRERLLSVVSALEGWACRIREKVNKE